jgi:hypothetical protein
MVTKDKKTHHCKLYRLLGATARYGLLPLSLLSGSAPFSGCKGDSASGSFDGEKSPYGQRTANTTNTYSITKPEGGSVVFTPGKNSEQKTLGDKSYDRVVLSDPSNSGIMLEGWYSAPSSDKVVLAGGSIGSSKSVVFDAPLSITVDPPEGKAQTISGSAVITTASFPSGSKAQGTGDYTLVESDVAVDTSAGKIEGANHYHVNGTLTGDAVPSDLKGKAVTGEVYYHPSYGVVAASLPEVGYSIGMSESSDCGKVDSSGHRVIRKTGVVTGATAFKLNTYDCAGNEFDADKNTHAAMLLELRWVDETQAKSTNKPGYPMIHIEFGTVFGVFPNDLVQAPKSVFHPEENDKGYVFWYAYVNQAAKNESGSNGIAYHINVSADSGFSPVRATGRIYYKTVK